MRKMMFMVLASIIVLPITLWAYEKGVPANWIRDMEEAYIRIDDYTAIFHKQEWVNGKLLDEETIFIKFKKPFRIYMKWIKDPHEGREALYVEGWNGNRIKIREGGLLGIVALNLDPNSLLAMKGNRHSITESGLGHLVKLIGESLRKGIRNDDLKFQEHGQETVYGRKTNKVELLFPKDETKGYYCYRAILNLDIGNKLPIRIQIYDWEDTMIEIYGYEKLILNAGLTNADFDQNNPE